MATQDPQNRKIKVELTGYDVEVLLRCLGESQNRYRDNGWGTTKIEKIINKIYRAMGVRI